ncbi:MAG TPA: LysR substrate-binding domain-containing protein [Pararhodobacter sp.]|nr:LysR substrate-binding domain-containing protein [Pararhodobacter sp.]
MGAMGWKLDDLPIFVAIAEQGSITAAADVLAVPKSTVSTVLARLERDLGVRLMARTSRNLRLTAEGGTFLRHAQAILEQAREADTTMAGMRAEPTGRLAVALPPAFCQEIVAPRLAAFRARYPRIALELIVTSRGAGLLRDQVDLAVVVGPLEDSDLVSRTLLAGPLIWVASPAYLARNPLAEGLEALRNHVQICEHRYGLARLPVRVAGDPAQIDLAQGVWHVNSPLAVREAVLAGAGVAPLPQHYCRSQIANGRLIQVFTQITFDIAASTLTAVYLSRRLMSPRLRVFLDFLSEACR